jgi:tetratricopeptide (TPR) repeat protein
VEEAPDDPERRRNQAGTRQKLGGLELCRERPEEARAHYDAAAAVFREHATGREARPEDRFNLVNAQLGQAAVLRRTRQPAESERLLGEALGTAEALARDFPDRAPVQELLARTLSLLGMVRVHLGRLAEAEEALERSLAVLGAGDAAQSLDPDAAYERISAQHQLGLARSARREIGPARKALEQAIALAEDFVRSWPDQARGAQLGARALKELGGTFIDEERAAAAEPFLRRSLAVYDRLIAERRGGHGYELERAVVLGNLGVALRAAGALDEAERELGKAREALERTIAADPKEADPGPRSSLGYLLHNLALLQLDRGRGADAEKTLAAAARTQTAALRIEPGRAATRAGLRQHQQMRGQLRLKESDLAGCAALAAELARDLAADPEARYQAALLYARGAARAAYDMDVAAAERFRLAALAELEEAARHGFAAPERLRQAKELQPLRELDGFRRLLRAQEAGGAQRRR